MKKYLITIVIILFIIILCFLYYIHRKNYIHWKTHDNIRVVFIGSGEDADAVLIKNDYAAILIDTGLPDDSYYTAEVLRQEGIDSIDLCVFTHPDKDHIGGAKNILGLFDVKEVVKTSFKKGSRLEEDIDRIIAEKGIRTTLLKDDRRYEYRDISLLLLPPRSSKLHNSNNNSICVTAVCNGKNIVIPGDAGDKRIKELLKEDLPQEVYIYKLPFHGRDLKKSEKLFERLSPVYTVVTAAEPEPETLEYLERSDTVLLSTHNKNVMFDIGR